ncbi:MAG TPA: hypothetical protein VMR62_28705 [Bryobacteraceae bacterium]|nr:hypothetical protein [Bryobacteraceae bacterium]
MRERTLGKELRRRVARELAAFERADDGIAVADLPPSGVKDIGIPFHFGEECVVEHVLGQQRTAADVS